MTGGDEKVPGPSATWYVPTNRRNIVAMLAAGLVMPPNGLPKYEADLMRSRPGGLLLTRSGGGSGWFGAPDGSEQDIPTVIELEASLPSNLHVLPESDGNVVACSVALPTSRISRIHLRTERDVDEFRARRYDNARPEELAWEITPRLFDADLPPVAMVAEWLKRLPEGGLTSRDVRDADALAGALFMVGACSVGAEDELRMRLSILSGLLGMRDPTVSVLSACTAALGGDAWLSSESDADLAVLRAAVGSVADLDPLGQFGARRLLRAVRDAAVAGVEQGARKAMEMNLDRAESILKAQAELRPFDPDSGLVSAKALLLFLLRPEPSEVVTWSRDMASDARAVVGAHLLAGLRAGARQLPVEMRSTDVRRIVEGLEADRLNRGLDWASEFAMVDERSLVVTKSATASGDMAVLTIDGVEISRVALPQPTTGDQLPLMEAGEPPPAKPRTVRPKTRREARIPDAAALLASADPEDDELVRRCASLCSTMGWTDLTETKVTAGEEGCRIRGAEYVFPGVAEARVRVDMVGLVERLTASPPAGPAFEGLVAYLAPERPRSRARRSAGAAGSADVAAAKSDAAAE